MPRVPQAGINLLQPFQRGNGRRGGIDNHLVAQRLVLRHRNIIRAGNHQQRRLRHPGAERRQIGPLPHAPGHHHIHPQLPQRVAPPDGIIHIPLHGGKGIGAPDDEKIGVAARLQGVAHLFQKLVNGDDVLQPGVVGRPLGEHLVLNMNAADARPLKGADGVHGVDGVAIAGAGIAQHGQAHRFGDPLGHLHLLGEGHQRLGNRQVGAAHIAAHINGVKAQRLHQPRGHRVVSAGRHDSLAGNQPAFQVGTQRHFKQTSRPGAGSCQRTAANCRQRIGGQPAADWRIVGADSRTAGSGLADSRQRIGRGNPAGLLPIIT